MVLNGRVSKTGDIEMPYETQDVAAGCEKRNTVSPGFLTLSPWKLLHSEKWHWFGTRVGSELTMRQLCIDVMWAAWHIFAHKQYQTGVSLVDYKQSQRAAVVCCLQLTKTKHKQDTILHRICTIHFFKLDFSLCCLYWQAVLVQQQTQPLVASKICPPPTQPQAAPIYCVISLSVAPIHSTVLLHMQEIKIPFSTSFIQLMYAPTRNQ